MDSVIVMFPDKLYGPKEKKEKKEKKDKKEKKKK